MIMIGQLVGKAFVALSKSFTEAWKPWDLASDASRCAKAWHVPVFEPYSIIIGLIVSADFPSLATTAFSGCFVPLL